MFTGKTSIGPTRVTNIKTKLSQENIQETCNLYKRSSESLYVCISLTKFSVKIVSTQSPLKYFATPLFLMKKSAPA